MKKVILLFTLAALMMACAKQDPADEQNDRWNGYEKYLKMGEQVHILWAGKNTNVGTATYGIDNNANFYVTYDCSASGWTMSETHMFAGDKVNMPLNKPGTPKIGQFPNSGCHSPRVSTVTYTVPLSTLPPCAEPGFVVASHCVVYSPNGKNETAWAEGDFKFTDKGWGWYDVYYFNQPVNEYTILYGTTYSDDTLHVIHIDATNGGAEEIFSEYVGNSDGTYDGAAYDFESTAFMFVKEDVQDQLWVNIISDEQPSFYSGTLGGDASSATYHDGSYIYVDATDNTIKEVLMNEDWSKGPETVIDEIPGSIIVNDIAISPDGDVLYILGEVNDGGKEMISYDIPTETFYSMDIDITTGGQIAFGSDGILYAIAPVTEGGSHSMIFMVDLASGTLTPIEDDIIIIDDPFSDLSGGPIM